MTARVVWGFAFGIVLGVAGLSWTEWQWWFVMLASHVIAEIAYARGCRDGRRLLLAVRLRERPTP